MRVRFPLSAPFMWPTIINIGSFRLQSLTVLAVLALFFATFIFWRKGKEEHYDTAELFDAFLLSGIFGVIIGRLAFVLFHWNVFSENWLLVFNIVKSPGNEPLLALSAAAIYLYLLAKKHKWDPFEVLDFWVTAISLGMIFVYFGFFLAGTYAGQLTTMPWGVVMPGTFEKSHPVQLYFVLFYSFLFNYLLKVEYKYRTFDWYRYGKKTAQSGFLLSMFLILVGFFYLVMSMLSLPGMVVQGQVIDPFIYFLVLFFGLILLFHRSGRSFKSKKKRLIR
jgi:phosphatidylglycerol---prolipoprotein diacylglyceryl transferase